MSLTLYKKRLDYGLIPYGPAIGQRAIKIDIGNNPETSYESGDLYRIFKQKIKEYELDKEYIEAINGSSSVFLLFKGGAIEKNENAEEWDEFFTALSKESVNVQKTLKLDKQGKIRPPFCIWYGLPEEMSSKRAGTADVYQYFNNCFSIISLPLSKKFNGLGLQQLLNHQFSVLCIEYKEKETEELYESFKGKYNLIKKVSFIDSEDNTECIKFCLDNDLRYYAHPKKNKLILKF
jgi:hypothetical protein